MNVKVVIMNDNAKFEQILVKMEKLEEMLKKLTAKKDILKSGDLMDNTDMCLLLGITKRTLQRYRQKGLVPYYMMSGKPYYKPEEVNESFKRIIKDRKTVFNPKRT